MAGQWIKTKSVGVRYRQHETRKHGVSFDKYFTIRYKTGGKEKTEALGWASQGWTEKKAAAVLAELKANHTTGQGPATLNEKREIRRQKEEATERKKQAEIEQELKRDATVFDRVFTDYCEANSHKKSLKDELSYYKNWIGPYIGKKRLDEILLLDLERIKRAMLKADRAPRSVQYIKSIIRQVYSHAAVHGVFSGEAPTIHFLKNQKFDNKRNRYLEPEESTLLLDEIRKRSEQTYRICLLSLNSGMRFGEISGLKWQHVREKSKEILVLDPKNDESRMVSMTQAVFTMFESMERGKSDELVFPARNGGRMTAVSKVFDRTVQQLGFNEGIKDRRLKVCFHSLRHSCASWLVNAGVELPVIARILGHKSLAMTMRYSHINDDSVQNAMGILDKQQDAVQEEKIRSIR
jgi:integrase